MLLTRQNLKRINKTRLTKPEETLVALPERVLQFGTGVLLRGLPDYFISEANSQGIFNGKIVVVKSTDQGSSEAFGEQDNLYTVCVRGYENGLLVEENKICSAISRVLSAKTQWQIILDCAFNPEMKVIISNTTEIGIQLIDDNINQQPPVSFPGKLLSFLYKRYQIFNGKSEAGMVIVPTESVSENGVKLAAIISELAVQNQLEEGFIQWLKNSNHFCNSLVDRIVPGKPDAETLTRLEEELGYKDNLLITAEPYKLWAIEAPAEIKEILSFHKADKGVVIQSDIGKYRELKLRLLNGTHTLCCGIAILLGFKTVKEAMADEAFLRFITSLIEEEIAPAIPYIIEIDEKQKFGQQVLDRFRNPTIAHQWHSITLNYSSKMKMRNIPLLLNYYSLFNHVPERFALGFAAYLMFMKPVKQEGNQYFGEINGKLYLINDDKAAYFKQKWELLPAAFVREILQNLSLWDYDLNILTGFSESVTEKLLLLEKNKNLNLGNITLHSL